MSHPVLPSNSEVSTRAALNFRVTDLDPLHPLAILESVDAVHIPPLLVVVPPLRDVKRCSILHEVEGEFLIAFPVVTREKVQGVSQGAEVAQVALLPFVLADVFN